MSCYLRAQINRVTLCCLIALFFSGCAAIKGMLKPMVCDCADASAAADQCPAGSDEKSEDTSAVAVARSEVSSSTGEAKLAANVDESDSDEPNKRKLERRKPEHDPLELVEPTIRDAVVTRDQKNALAKLRKTYPISKSLPKSAVLLRANFDAGEGQELAIIEPGRRIQIFNTSERLAELKFSTSTAKVSPKKTDRSGTSAVKVVRDGTAQILTHWTEKNEDGSVVYKVGVFKLIESYIGTAFEAELASKARDSKVFASSGTYEFLRGDDHAFIRWIPTGDKGDFDASQATVYKWNEWEGVYRVPKPPPTAPEREKLQTRKGDFLTKPLAVK